MTTYAYIFTSLVTLAFCEVRVIMLWMVTV